MAGYNLHVSVAARDRSAPRQRRRHRPARRAAVRPPRARRRLRRHDDDERPHDAVHPARPVTPVAHAGGGASEHLAAADDVQRVHQDDSNGRPAADDQPDAEPPPWVQRRMRRRARCHSRSWRRWRRSRWRQRLPRAGTPRRGSAHVASRTGALLLAANCARVTTSETSRYRPTASMTPALTAASALRAFHRVIQVPAAEAAGADEMASPRCARAARGRTGRCR